MHDPLTVLILALLAPSYAGAAMILPFAMWGGLAAQWLGTGQPHGFAGHPLYDARD